MFLLLLLRLLFLHHILLFRFFIVLPLRRLLLLPVLKRLAVPIKMFQPRNYKSTVTVFVARGSAVGCGTALQAGRSRVRFPMVSLDFFFIDNPSGRTMALVSTQPLTEMSTRNVSWR